jgi:hypothetical protein
LIVKRLSPLLLLPSLMIGLPATVLAERYQVSTDQDGQTRIEQVESDDSDTDTKTKQKTIPSAEPQYDAAPDAKLPSNSRIQVWGVNESAPPYEMNSSEVTSAPDEKPVIVHDDRTPEQPGQTDGSAESSPKGIGLFEQNLLDSEGKTREQMLLDLESARERQPKRFLVEGERYVDGDALLEDETLAEEGPRYFTTVDAEGRPLNVFYSPVLEKRARQLESEDTWRLAKGTEFFPQDADIRLVDESQLDSVARQILDEGQKREFFAGFARMCCNALPHRATHQLVDGVVIFHEFGNDDLPYRFAEGDSRFVLIRVPDADTNYTVRVRSFIREFSRMGIEHGLFLPQITLLDAAKNPLRLIRNIGYTYVAETWTNYAYLEGIFEIRRETETAQESFILLHTDTETLRKVSFFQTEEETIQVQHLPTGSISVDLYP